MIKLIYEFLGTLAFTFVVLKYGKPLYVGAALAVIALFAGPISGGHVNPAISFAMMMAGKLSQNMFLQYVVAQLLGAYAGLEVSKMM